MTGISSKRQMKRGSVTLSSPWKDLLANQKKLVCLRPLNRNVLKLSSVLALLENRQTTGRGPTDFLSVKYYS